MSIEVYHVPPPPKEATIEISRPEPCRCERTELRRLIQTNGVTQYKFQCLVCGKRGSAIRQGELTREQRDGAPEIDDQLALDYSERHWREWNEARAAASNHQSNKWWVWYNEYLASPVWQARREMVMRRATPLGGRIPVCESCFREPATEVHHETYQRVGREPLFDLRAVCHRCHQQITDAGR